MVCWNLIVTVIVISITNDFLYLKMPQIKQFNHRLWIITTNREINLKDYVINQDHFYFLHR